MLSQSGFAQLTTVTSFGSNPGNLNMYVHVPSGITGPTPLVVVMHGCGQTAQSFANESGWSELADEYGFLVLYPEQKSANNLNSCFNWYLSGDIERGQGEAQSIYSMVETMISTYVVDENRVFVTGLSAGACMSTVMMACYPDVFKKGAVMAGTPYKSADGLFNPLLAMNPGINNTATVWGDFVRNAYPSYTGSYPTLAIFQGSLDLVINPINQLELVEQWTNIHNTDATEDIVNTDFNGNSLVDQTIYSNSTNDTIVLTYTISGMGHAISVDPGTGIQQGGTSGLYAQDKNFFSSYWAADFFGLLNSPVTSSKIKAISAEKSILLYPSPNNGVFVLQNTLNKPLNYEVLDIQGCLQLKGVLQLGKNQINMQDIKDGLYFFKTEQGACRFSVIRS